MASITNKLTKQQLIQPPGFLEDNIHYETIMGSQAYGCQSEGSSDFDVYGFCIEPVSYIFPTTAGYVPGYDKNIPTFEQFSQHHVLSGKKSYDVTIYGLVKYVRLCADANPNMIDSLFTPPACVLHITPLGRLVKDNRKLFLSKKLWYTLRGYAHSQLAALTNGRNSSNPRRKSDIETHGFDLKFSYHVVRLLNEAEQIFRDGDLDLQRDREQYKSIRRGEWTLLDIQDYFKRKEKVLEDLYHTSNAIPERIREQEIKDLLLKCIEMHYGSIDKLLQVDRGDKYKKALLDIKQIVGVL